MEQADGIDVGLIIARSQMGGRDLYYGVPNVKGATIEEVMKNDHGNMGRYETSLVLRLTNGNKFNIMIVQD